MKRALIAASLLLGAPAWALPGSEVRIEVRDAADRPADAFVLSRELGELGKLHGTTTVCVRADLRAAVGGKALMSLPGPTLDRMLLRDLKTETIAYRPRHCLARAKNVETATLRLRPAPSRPEERLPYLEEVAASLFCRRGAWSSGSAASLERMIAAIEGEMKPLVRGPYERQIADRIRMHLQLAKGFPSLEEVGAGPALVTEASTPPPRDFIIVPASHSSTYDARGNMWIVAPRQMPEQIVVLSPPSGNRPGNAAGVVGARDPIPGAIVPGGTSAWDRSPPVIRCRLGEPSKCDVDQRNTEGETALGSAVRFAKADEVKLLLDAGANPSLPVTPGGLPAIDLQLQRMLRMSPTGWDADQARAIVAMLAANPKTTLPKALKADLAADPAQWNDVRETQGMLLLAEVRSTLSRIPARDESVAPCEPLYVLPLNFPTREPPLRLRRD